MAEIKDKEIETRIVRSRIQLLMKYPFYGTLALQLQIVEDPSVGTAAVDGKRFYYSPDFIKKLTEGELNWIVAHEVMHCALGHIWRRGTRQHQKFNIACDYAIHSLLHESESSDFKMPKGCLYDPKFENKSAEDIYDMLPELPSMDINGNGSSKGQDEGEGQGEGQQGNGVPQTIDNHSKWGEDDTQANNQVKEKDWLEKMISAAEVAESKSQGNVPGMIKRLIGKLKKPQKDWRQLLAEFVQFEVFDYGFLPPDKRLYGFSDVLMPDYNEETEKVQDMVFVIDTSGSIGDRELVSFFSELVGMMQQFQSSVKGHILYVDSNVAAVYDFEDVDDILSAKPAGGGGTDMQEAIRYTMKKTETDDWDTAGMCILTDGYTDYDMTESDIPFKVLWLITNESQTPPYGQVARMKIG